jgi:hypothetical protein
MHLKAFGVDSKYKMSLQSIQYLEICWQMYRYNFPVICTMKYFGQSKNYCKKHTEINIKTPWEFMCNLQHFTCNQWLGSFFVCFIMHYKLFSVLHVCSRCKHWPTIMYANSFLRLSYLYNIIMHKRSWSCHGNCKRVWTRIIVGDYWPLQWHSKHGYCCTITNKHDLTITTLVAPVRWRRNQKLPNANNKNSAQS